MTRVYGEEGGRAFLAWEAIGIAVGLTLIPLFVCYSGPILGTPSIEVLMTEDEALAASAQVDRKFHLGPAGGRTVIWFAHARTQRAFIDSEGGAGALAAVIERGDLAPWHWCVRRFKEGEEIDSTVCFDPNGALRSFDQQHPETEPGPVLPEPQAHALALDALNALGVDRTHLVEQTAVTSVRSSGRVDHRFLWWRTDRTIGRAPLTVRVDVDGDRVAFYSRSIEVPDEFAPRFERRRGIAGLLAQPGTSAMYLGLYVVPILVVLARRSREKIRWRAPALTGLAVGAASLAVQVVGQPLGVDYDTSTAWQTYVNTTVLHALRDSVVQGAAVAVALSAYDVIWRKLRPNHVDPWLAFSPSVAGARLVVRQAWGAVAAAGGALSYVVVFHATMQRVLGWPVSVDFLTNPSTQALRYAGVSGALQAFETAVSEEVVFRGVLLGLLATLARRASRPSVALAAAVGFQALLFALGHANSVEHPMYGRVLELLPFEVVVGVIALRWGLLPCVLLHFTYDLVVATSPLLNVGRWTQRGALFALICAPLLWSGMLRMTSAATRVSRLGEWPRGAPSAAGS